MILEQAVPNFNSIKVRLTALTSAKIVTEQANFNSIKVRLTVLSGLPGRRDKQISIPLRYD